MWDYSGISIQCYSKKKKRKERKICTWFLGVGWKIKNAMTGGLW